MNEGGYWFSVKYAVERVQGVRRFFIKCFGIVGVDYTGDVKRYLISFFEIIRGK